MEFPALRKKQIFLFLLCCLLSVGFAQEKSVVTVERAQSTETRKNEISNSDVIFFRGDVALSVVKGDSKIRIWAELIQYDRERQMLYAEGNVHLEQESASKGLETMYAQALLFDVGTLEGIFDDGQVIQNQDSGAAAKSSGTTLLVNSDIFGRNSSGTVAFKDGLITFCDDPEPHWKIKASRIWLLPGNEFAFLNGVLYIGNIPVFYLPFFYYPKDELVFNPVFGFRQREGFFMQTTTYIIGRKPVEKNEDGSNLFNFTQSDPQAEQKLDGLFLRSTGKKLEELPVNSLKILADFYTGLGILTGVQGSFKPKKIVTALDFNLNLGFSKTLFPVSGSNIYVPNNPETGLVNWDRSELFGLPVPFRYAANVKLNLSMNVLNLSLSLPLYSDPYFDNDFFNMRKESMDWISYLMANTSNEKEEIDANKLLSSFNWTLSGSLRAPSAVLDPYITTLELSSFEAGIQFSSKTNQSFTSGSMLSVVSPLRTFYFPQILTPLKVTAAVGGTLFSTETKPETKNSLAPSGLVPPADLAEQQEEKTGKEKVAAAENDGQNSAGTGAANDGAEANPEESFADRNAPLADSLFPDLRLTPPAVIPLGGIAYSLGYKINPAFSSQNVYPAEQFKSPADIKWGNFASTFVSVSGTAEIVSNLGWRNNFVSMSNRLLFEPKYERHPYISGAYYDKMQKEQIIYNDYIAQKLDLVNANTISFKPFVLNEYFADSSVYWNMSAKVLRTQFAGTVSDPYWKYLPPSWDTASFTVHSMNLNLASKQNGGTWKQSLLLSADLPPLSQAYTGRLTVSFPFFEVSAYSGLKKPNQASSWNFVPFEQSAKISLFKNKLVFMQDYKFDIDANRSQSFNVKGSFAGFEIAYTMLYTSTYKLDKTAGWVVQTEQEFQPYTLSFKYATENKTFYAWKNRVQVAPSLSTSLVFDLIRQTNTYFIFEPGITFRIDQFLDITFSAKSRNDVMFRYFQDIAGFSPTIPGEKNIFIDLFNSFAFWDKEKRTSSGFKLSALSLKVEHNLHDWTFASELTIQPRLLYDSSAKPYYDMSPYFTLSIVWKPLNAMKTTIVDDYGTFKLNP